MIEHGHVQLRRASYLVHFKDRVHQRECAKGASNRHHTLSLGYIAMKISVENLKIETYLLFISYKIVSSTTRH